MPQYSFVVNEVDISDESVHPTRYEFDARNTSDAIQIACDHLAPMTFVRGNHDLFDAAGVRVYSFQKGN